MSECDPPIVPQGPLDRPTLAKPVQGISTGDSLSFENSSSAKPAREESLLSTNGVQPKPVAPGTVLHVSKLLLIGDPDEYGIPETWDSLDETLNADKILSMFDKNVLVPSSSSIFGPKV